MAATLRAKNGSAKTTVDGKAGNEKPSVTRSSAKKASASKSVAMKAVAKKPLAKKPLAKKALAARKTATGEPKPPRKARSKPAKVSYELHERRAKRVSATDRLDLPPPATGQQLVERVSWAIERELNQIEMIVGGHRMLPKQRTEAERRARTLASLARTLAVVTQLRDKNQPRPDDDDDAGPHDLDELRDALAQRLERLVAEQSQSDDGANDAA